MLALVIAAKSALMPLLASCFATLLAAGEPGTCGEREQLVMFYEGGRLQFAREPLEQACFDNGTQPLVPADWPYESH